MFSNDYFSNSAKCLSALESTDREWFAVITSSLNPETTAKLQAIFVTAEQRRQALG